MLVLSPSGMLTCLPALTLVAISLNGETVSPLQNDARRVRFMLDLCLDQCAVKKKKKKINFVSLRERYKSAQCGFLCIAIELRDSEAASSSFLLTPTTTTLRRNAALYFKNKKSTWNSRMPAAHRYKQTERVDVQRHKCALYMRRTLSREALAAFTGALPSKNHAHRKDE